MSDGGSSMSPRTVTFVFAGLALVLYMHTQNSELVAQSHAFRGAVGSETLAADQADLSQQIRARQELVTQLRHANEELKAQQDALLTQARSGDLARVLRGDSAASSTLPQAQHKALLQMPLQPQVQQLQQQQQQQQQQFVAPVPSGAVAFFNQHVQRHLYVSQDAGGQELHWLRCDSDETVALPQKTFIVEPVDQEWFALRSLATDKYVEMIPMNQPLAWVLRASSANIGPQHQFAFKADGLFNRGSQAFINVISDSPQLPVRGHGNGKNKQRAAGTEPTTKFQMQQVTQEALQQDAQRVATQAKTVQDLEQDELAQIQAFPTSSEKRVVSYGLYGSNPKYVNGAIRNSELVKVYFPGWVCRFYCGSDVPAHILNKLRDNGSEIIMITNIKGSIAGMFWRFLVADDPTVDRWIVRDSDSRLNPRERFAVEEWIQSGKAVHTIRDHPNHDRTLNGGLWGGTKGAISGMTDKVKAFANKQSYGGDLQFLMTVIWPLVKDDQIAHDAYTCHKYPNSHPFPTKRPANYQHVGQVFDADDNFRVKDINGFMRGVEVPRKCRKRPEWKYG